MERHAIFSRDFKPIGHQKFNDFLNLQKGFSLLELLIVLTLSSLMLGGLIPFYQKWFAQENLHGAAERMITAISFAKSEAVKRQTVVAICKSRDLKTCSGNWNNGWIVFVDQKKTGRVESDHMVLRSYPPLAPNCFLTWNGSRSKDYLQLSPKGGTHGQNGSFLFYNPLVKICWVVRMSQTGRARLEKADHKASDIGAL